MTTKSKKSFNSLIIGLIPGIIIPLFTVYFLYLTKNLAMEFKQYIEYMIQHKFITKILSVAVVSNLAVFFLFLQGDRYKSARGVILATLIYGLITLVKMLFF
ncbi:MAG: hypothetical protein U9Q83_06820 [Bacteroidota bacterium]|nr:hypothetical protein [Bacteroidota bacterium]